MSFPRYPAYKPSGVEWLGEVPEHWNVDRMKWAIEQPKNGIWGNEESGDENDIPCVRVADFDRQGLRVVLDNPTIRNVTRKEREGRVLAKNDLLIEKSGGGELQPVGCVVIYEDDWPAISSNFVAKASARIGMSASYWRYLHSAAYSARINTRSIKQTSGIQNLDQSQYLDESSCYPPLLEQEQIAIFIDHETAKIDALIAEQQRLIELLQEKRQAVISHAVTKGLNPDAPMKDSGVGWLGEVPEHWEVKELKSLRKPSTCITYGIVQAGPHVEDGIPYIRTSDMSGDALPMEGYLKTSHEIDGSYARSKVASGDLVIAIRASVGKVLVVPGFLDGANLTQGTAKFSPAANVDVRFVEYAFSASFLKAAIDVVSKGATFLEITLDALRRLRFPVPPHQEQIEIVASLASKVASLNDLVEDAKRAVKLLQERRSALISAAVTGQIDVRGLVPEAVAA